MNRLYPRYRRAGRFFGRRVNCEYVPALPAWIVSRMLDDPRKIPYLLIWRNRRDDTVQEAVRISVDIEPPALFPPDWAEMIEIKRHDGTRNFIRTKLRPLPRHGGKSRYLFCPYCQNPRRALYGWQPGGQYTSSVQTCGWKCRSCAGLRYASEGGALVHRGRGVIARLFELYDGPLRSERPEPWYPYVFTSPQDAIAGGLASSGDVTV